MARTRREFTKTTPAAVGTTVGGAPATDAPQSQHMALANEPGSGAVSIEAGTIRVYDHTFEGDRAWFRFEFRWTDQKTGEKRTRAGMQVYRIEDGKLAETWLMLQPLGSAWTDVVAQEHWTSSPPIK